MKLNTLFELIIVLFFSVAFLWVGIGAFWDHKIEHPFPYSYLATDAFQHQTRAQWIKDAGNYKFEGSHYSTGRTDIIGFYPPILHHASILLSYLTGLEVYDTIFFTVFFLSLITILVLYSFLRMWNENIAILSLSLPIFIFLIKDSWVGFFYGHWPSLIGNFFFLSFCLSLYFWNVKNSWIFISILFSGTIFGHTSSTIFSGLFLVFFIIKKMFSKEWTDADTKNFVKFLALTLIVSGYFLLIFSQSWMKTQPYKFRITTSWDNSGGGVVSLMQFGFMYYFILAGIIIGLLVKQKNFFILFALFSLIVGYTNYVGFERRAFNLRFYWPIFLALFSALSITTVLNKINFNKTIKTIICILITISLILLPIKLYGNSSENIEGIMNKYTWEAENWIKDKTPENATIFYFYSDIFLDQSAHVANTKKQATLIQTKDFIETAKNNQLKRNYLSWTYSEYGGGFPYKCGIFKICRYSEENSEITTQKNTDVCKYEYFIFDKKSRLIELAKVNILIVNKLLNTGNFEKLFENELTVVLHNKLSGGNCFEQTTII